MKMIKTQQYQQQMPMNDIVPPMMPQDTVPQVGEMPQGEQQFTDVSGDLTGQPVQNIDDMLTDDPELVQMEQYLTQKENEMFPTTSLMPQEPSQIL